VRLLRRTAHALFPVRWHLALGLLSKESGCQLPDANLPWQGGFRPLSRAVRAVSHAAYWVRLLRRIGPRSLTKTDTTKRKAACKVAQPSAVYPGSAAPSEGTLAPGYGSCLLPLRLPSLCSQAKRFSFRLIRELVAGVCSPRRLPVSARPLRVPTANRNLAARIPRPNEPPRAGPSSNLDRIGHWVRSARSKPSTQTDLTRPPGGFFSRTPSGVRPADRHTSRSQAQYGCDPDWGSG